MARGGGIETDLLLVDPARLTVGSRLWRFYPAILSRSCAAFTGVAYGWEDINRWDVHRLSPRPSSVRSSSATGVACRADVELGDDGQPAAVTMVSPVRQT